jgi:hypothetical protein
VQRRRVVSEATESTDGLGIEVGSSKADGSDTTKGFNSDEGSDVFSISDGEKK